MHNLTNTNSCLLLNAMLNLPVKRRYSHRYDEYCIQCKKFDIKHRGNLHKAQAFKLLHDLIYRISRVFGLSTTCDNQFAGTEQKNDHLRLRQPVDKTGELLGLVLNVLKPEADGNCV